MSEPTPEQMLAIRRRVCTYRCGEPECGYLERDRWAVHQAHYESHRKEE